MTAPICFYHSADLDGLCSGAIVRHFVPDVELVGYNYGQPFPWEKIQGREVIMVDVSLPIEDMQRVCDEAERFIWIDHHKSAIDAVQEAGCKPIIRWCRVEDEGGRKVAACEQVWEYFAPAGQKLPLAVHLLSRYDVWDHEDERVLPFQYGARMALFDGIDDSLWFGSNGLLTDVEECVFDIIQTGRYIVDYQRSEDAKVARTQCFDADLDGLKVLACNRGLCSSKLFDSVWDPEKYHLMSPFYLNKRGQWMVSLYTTRDDVDCSEIAKRYGGGGHRQAAGFVAEQVPYQPPSVLQESSQERNGKPS